MWWAIGFVAYLGVAILVGRLCGINHRMEEVDHWTDATGLPDKWQGIGP
jgi:hypothetical protein